MALQPRELAKLSVEEIDLEPRYVERIPNAKDHGDYLEAMHESTVRNLATIHLRLVKGDTDAAIEMLSRLRQHLDGLWEQRKEVAVRGVGA
jgi:hypothetical protein